MRTRKCAGAGASASQRQLVCRVEQVSAQGSLEEGAEGAEARGARRGAGRL